MNFRQWCYEMWHEHQTELEAYGQPLPSSAKEYFAKYKYWLKREYKHQRNTDA